MGPTWALLPIKPPEQAKSRLASALEQYERAALAGWLMHDVMAALKAARGVDGIAVVGMPPVAWQDKSSIRWIKDDPALGLSGNIDAAMDALADAGAATVAVVPADLPLLKARDVEALLGAHRGALSVVPAASDGGTNALVMSPPGVIRCCFGADSARLHLERAQGMDLPAQALRATPAAADIPGNTPGPSLAGFARDLDTVDDVRWLCAQPDGSQAHRYLRESGICARLCTHD